MHQIFIFYYALDIGNIVVNKTSRIYIHEVYILVDKTENIHKANLWQMVMDSVEVNKAEQ